MQTVELGIGQLVAVGRTRDARDEAGDAEILRDFIQLSATK